MGGDEMPKIDLYGLGRDVDLRAVAPLYGVANEEEPDCLDYDIKGRGVVEKMFLYSGSAYLTGACACIHATCVHASWWTVRASTSCMDPFPRPLPFWPARISSMCIDVATLALSPPYAGILSGGVLGGRSGWKAAPSPRFWIRVNSVMNGAGKIGSKWGNNAGVIGKSCTFVFLCLSFPMAMNIDPGVVAIVADPVRLMYVCFLWMTRRNAALMYSLSESALDHLEAEQYLGGHQATNPVLAGALSGLLYKSTGGWARATAA